MLHKRRGAHKSGVSDYFGVLGIESLLPDEQEGGAPSSVDNNASDDDGPPSESINDEYERSDSALTAKAGNLSAAGTPRNANLSSRRATSLSAVREEDGDEELKFLEERFQREIIDVSLVSSPAALDPDWSISDGNLIVQSISPLANDRLYLAYRRRGRPNATFEDSDDCDENDTTDDEAQKTRPQHYFAPAVADITIHNVKVRRSTVPLLESKLRANEISRTEKAQQPNKTTISPTKSFSAQTVDTLAHGAKQLSILAKRSGLAATTKDMATGAMAGLAQTLKERSPLNENSVVGGVVETILKTAQSPTKDKGSATVESDNSVRFGQPRHIYDTGTGSFETDLDGAGNFTDVNGEVNTYQSGMIKTPEKARRRHFFPDVPSHSNLRTEEGVILKPMDEILSIILRGKEWVVPSICSTLHLPTPELLQQRTIEERRRSRQSVNLVDRTHAMPSPLNASASSRSSFGIGSVGSPSSLGVEAMYMSPTSSRSVNSGGSNEGGESALFETDVSPDPSYLPSLVAATTALSPVREKGGDEFVYIPVLSLRRQRVGENERYHEDPAIVDLKISTFNPSGLPQLPIDEDDEEEFGRSSKALMHNVAHVDILKKTKWTASLSQATNTPSSSAWPVLLLRRNVPNGLCDLPFAAKVLDRFPRQDYRGLPFPEEELPMFCYPNGSRLVRDRLRNLAMPRSYGFVVKNERGDSIYVSCLTFMEPLTKERQRDLDLLSSRRRDVSLPHRARCESATKQPQHLFNRILLGYNDTITFENKTICLVGRYPYWTEFRRFLTHLHLLSGSTSDIPIERNISHLLLAVPIPKPGGQCVLVPFSTMDEPMALSTPPLKDLPLVDLTYERLFAALDVPTVVTVALGFLCLEKKVILISTRQSLLLDCCELLKSLLFPFELCAPYVPRLTQPFMSCLEFPGATFVGIHDDKTEARSLANYVRDDVPEDSIVVELDSGEIKCDGNRYEVLKAAYQIIPNEPRNMLIKEVEALCQDAGLVPGQEPLDCGVDAAIDSTVPPNVTEALRRKSMVHKPPLDDRGIRDCFLRFFCSILGGYERNLVVPDADYLTSGNDWFDSSKFLSASSGNSRPFLSTLVETQLFQSFIQRRTEASDVKIMFFDECLIDFYSSAEPYGRLNPAPPTEDMPRLAYDLLVDQCCTERDQVVDDGDSSIFARSDLFEKSIFAGDSETQATSGYAESTISDTSSLDRDGGSIAVNSTGDLVTMPSTAHLPLNEKFNYCANSSPSFPTRFDDALFLPREPDTLATELPEVPPPILIRSDREREESTRLCNSTVSRSGPQKQHRCLWQLPKFMGSQFFGAWLMCVPSQVAQPGLGVEDKTKILIRALGALRTLRSHRRVVADEAAYRALIVACARCGTDRRIELTKLYALMRTDGIFPNAVTLGQYTKAIAEGYSNANTEGSNRVGMQLVISSDGWLPKRDTSIDLDSLDSTLESLEESGLKWRHGKAPAKGSANPQRSDFRVGDDAVSKEGSKPKISPAKTFDTATTTHQRSKAKRSWLPVRSSSSFCPQKQSRGQLSRSISFVAMWSRTTVCKSCSYVPLDEEVQCGWDVVHGREMSSTVTCPRCGDTILPLLGYQVFEMSDLSSVDSKQNDTTLSTESDLHCLPPQLESVIRDGGALAPSIDNRQTGHVTYLSPYKLRFELENLLMEYEEEEVFNRDRLRELNAEVFFNLWWYSARFSLPLPLAIHHSLQSNGDGRDASAATSCPADMCAFASWDKSVALHGCRSAAKAIEAAKRLARSPDRSLREKLYENPHSDTPLFSFFNLQGYAQNDWDHSDFSELLVTLVKSCEGLDLLPVVECVHERNMARRRQSETLNESFESVGSYAFSMGASTQGSLPLSVELDCYRTILYLVRYQCTTAFHAFFPTTLRGCKGRHFWCSQGTPLPIFDRAFREAAEIYNKQYQLVVPLPNVSEVALGFRSIFGHLI